jgi:hypothetical protein
MANASINVRSVSTLMKMQNVKNALFTVTNVTSKTRPANNARKTTSYSMMYSVLTDALKDMLKKVKHA